MQVSTPNIAGVAYGVATGINTYTVTIGTGALSTNPTIRIMFTNANTATSPTLNVNGVGAVTIKKAGTTDLSIGDIIAGTIYTLTYDGMFWQSDIGIAGEIFDWVPAFTGYSVDPTVVRAKYRVIDSMCEIWLYLMFNSGTSNSTSVTFTGPVNAVNSGETGQLMRIVNGGISQVSSGIFLTNAGSNSMICYLTNSNTSNTAWTNSSGKSFNARGAYLI